jgi:hypothetical protein
MRLLVHCRLELREGKKGPAGCTGHRQKVHEVQTSLGYIMRQGLKQKTKKDKKNSSQQIILEALVVHS